MEKSDKKLIVCVGFILTIMIILIIFMIIDATKRF